MTHAAIHAVARTEESACNLQGFGVFTLSDCFPPARRGVGHDSRRVCALCLAPALLEARADSFDWVQRMASTSNQETFRADIDGRLVFDILRHVGPSLLTANCPARDVSCRAASDVFCTSSTHNSLGCQASQ